MENQSYVLTHKAGFESNEDARLTYLDVMRLSQELFKEDDDLTDRAVFEFITLSVYLFLINAHAQFGWKDEVTLTLPDIVKILEIGTSGRIPVDAQEFNSYLDVQHNSLLPMLIDYVAMSTYPTFSPFSSSIVQLSRVICSVNYDSNDLSANVARIRDKIIKIDDSESTIRNQEIKNYYSIMIGARLLLEQKGN